MAGFEVEFVPLLTGEGYAAGCGNLIYSIKVGGAYHGLDLRRVARYPCHSYGGGGYGIFVSHALHGVVQISKALIITYKHSTKEPMLEWGPCLNSYIMVSIR